MNWTMEGRDNDGPQESPGVSDWPRVSVIVPTRNRAVTLVETLRALASQDYPLDRLQIIVVDNSSADDTDTVAADVRISSPFPLQYFRKTDQGPAAARNYGAARSSGEILAFTDSDCAMRTDWIRRGVDALRTGLDVVSGPVCPVINRRRVPGFFYHQTDHRQRNTLYPTANVFYRRQAFERLGGFDETFGTFPWGMPVGGDDVDLAWRSVRAGYRAGWAEDVAVSHEASSTRAMTWLIEPVRLQIMPRLIRQNPELRENLFQRFFVSREYAAFYPAIVGTIVAVCARRPVVLVLAVPWLWLLRSMIDRDLPFLKRWWRIPFKYGLTAVKQCVGAGTLIVASIRYWTPVL